jgi:hydrogenase nickel incorporation protein HypB
MCTTCGCGSDEGAAIIRKPGEASFHEHVHGLNHDHHHHDHTHDHNHSHSHTSGHTHNDDHSHVHEITLEQDILLKNNLLAERNRGFFEAKEIIALNMVSSPGSGKTSLLERTINDLKHETNFYVIEGDQQTMNDAERIKNTGAPVVQVNTGSGCHLDSNMVHKAVKNLEIKEKSVLFIENVGNLVCPAMFDLGESKRIVVMSITEGEDKPIKYPAIFRDSDICIINKIDLLPHIKYDMAKAREYIGKVNRNLTIFELSVTSGEGLQKWYDWLKNQ